MDEGIESETLDLGVLGPSLTRLLGLLGPKGKEKASGDDEEEGGGFLRAKVTPPGSFKSYEPPSRDWRRPSVPCPIRSLDNGMAFQHVQVRPSSNLADISFRSANALRLRYVHSYGIGSFFTLLSLSSWCPSSPKSRFRRVVSPVAFVEVVRLSFVLPFDDVDK